MKNTEVRFHNIAKRIRDMKEELAGYTDVTEDLFQELDNIVKHHAKEVFHVSGNHPFHGDKIVVIKGEHVGKVLTVKHKNSSYSDFNLSYLYDADFDRYREVIAYNSEEGEPDLVIGTDEFCRIESGLSTSERFETEKRIAYVGERIIITCGSYEGTIFMTKDHATSGTSGAVNVRWLEGGEIAHNRWFGGDYYGGSRYYDFNKNQYEVIVEKEPLSPEHKRYVAVEKSASFLSERYNKTKREGDKCVNFTVDYDNLSVTGYLYNYGENKVLDSFTKTRVVGEVFNEHIFKALVYCKLMEFEPPNEILNVPQPKILRKGMVVVGSSKNDRDFYNENRRFTLTEKEGELWKYKENEKDWLTINDIGEILLDKYETKTDKEVKNVSSWI